MADKPGSIAHEGRIAEDMIGMTVGVDDIADRLVGARADRRKQPLAFTHAAAGIDHSDRVVADDEADIGNVAFVLARHQRGLALMHEHAGRDLADRQHRLLGLREFRCPQHHARGKDQGASSHTFASVPPRSVVDHFVFSP